MTEGKNTQLDLETEGSSSPAATQKMKVKMEDSESKIESPTLEKSESRRNGVVISSLARNLLAERYKDRFAAQLLGDEDEDETDDSSSTSPDGSSPSVSESIDISGTSPKDKSNDLLEK